MDNTQPIERPYGKLIACSASNKGYWMETLPAMG